MSEEVVKLLAERTGRKLGDANMNVEQFDAIDERTLFVGYAGHSDDPSLVMRATARPVVAAFAVAMRELDWPEDVDGLVLRAYDPTEPQHRREGALEWEVSRSVAERYLAASEGESEAGDGQPSEQPDAVVNEAVETARMVYADGHVEPISFDDLS
ncbi:hypothetical protein [Halomarina rubra]|uniref:Uncharacterized protein n=1 Tax=Halomarina rubra TaxID=2071873 RepID=A0ABD6AXA7_9EURY|nr:hypothetical protein [Halomarina rubra]